MMFNWIARNSKETESEQVTTILSVAYVIYAIQLNSQYHNSIEYKFSEPNFFLMLYVFVRSFATWITSDQIISNTKSFRANWP